MAQSLLPRRIWMQFLRRALSGAVTGGSAGDAAEGLGAGEALDLAAAFSRCRALALYRPADGAHLELQACSAPLRGQRKALEALLGAAGDGTELCHLTLQNSSGLWKVPDLVDQGMLLALRGLALSLECLAVSVCAPEGGSLTDGFLLALWQDEEPAADCLDRAALAGMALSLGLRASEARLATQAVERELDILARSRPDLLAHLAPHSRLLRELESAVSEAGERGERLALILVDADDLAAVNLEHGPQAGDRVLEEIAAILVEGAGAEDIVVRYGMEEFAMLVHGSDPSHVQRRALEIQKRVQERALPGPAGRRLSSVSVGVACLPDPLAPSAAALRLKAEQALEMARQQRPGGLIIL